MPVEVLSASEALGEAVPNITEDGETFEDNARIKARAIAGASMMLTLADDSGLEVDALGGRPGVRSRRFAGEGATDAENNAELLRRLDEVYDDDRRARFRAAIVMVDPWNEDEETVVTGTCEGVIARKPSGSGGFGYDPLFIVRGKDRTLADLSEREKAEISHRGRALRDLQPKLEALIQTRLAQADSIMRGSYKPPPSERK
jgi:XTP/dITP diphosphohydrolase